MLNQYLHAIIFSFCFLLFSFVFLLFFVSSPSPPLFFESWKDEEGNSVKGSNNQRPLSRYTFSPSSQSLFSSSLLFFPLFFFVFFVFVVLLWFISSLFIFFILIDDVTGRQGQISLVYRGLLAIFSLPLISSLNYRRMQPGIHQQCKPNNSSREQI